jgi:hypothetical protein
MRQRSRKMCTARVHQYREKILAPRVPKCHRPTWTKHRRIQSDRGGSLSPGPRLMERPDLRVRRQRRRAKICGCDTCLRVRARMAAGRRRALCRSSGQQSLTRARQMTAGRCCALGNEYGRGRKSAGEAPGSLPTAASTASSSDSSLAQSQAPPPTHHVHYSQRGMVMVCSGLMRVGGGVRGPGTLSLHSKAGREQCDRHHPVTGSSLQRADRAPVLFWQEGAEVEWAHFNM